MFVRRRIRDIVKHSAELMLLTKKCIRCAMQPAIVHCDTCSILLCSACLIIDDHPVSHKLNTLDSAVVACEQTRAPSAIRRQLTHILREPENRATHVCLKCNYRPVDDYEQHQGHSLAEVDQGADILRPLIQQELPEKMELIGLIKSQRFEAEETIMIAKENEDLCADNLLSAQKIIENMIERSYETGSSTILTMWKDSTDALNLGIQSIDQRKQNLISKIIAFERALELGRSHAAAGILAYLKALNILEKQSIHDIENTCEDVQTKILAVKQMKTSLIEQVATVSHTIEKHIHQYLAETEFDRYELPDGYTPPENVESQLMDLRTSHKIADLTGVPLNTGDKVTQSTIPYWTLREAPNITDVLLRIDTFHPSWEQVRVSIYHKQWLTIHAVSKSGSMPALNSPPECVIPLWETTIRHFESKELGGGSFSPVAQVLAKAGNSGIEIIRYKIDGTPLTYWILGCTEPQTVKKWAKILTKYSTRSRTAGHKGAFTPSTNPAINVKDLGIFMPAEKWAASHAISGTNVALAGEDADNITNQNSYCAVE